MITQHIDGIPVRLKRPFDFGFIGGCGKVFKVFDDQDSGNICFGVSNGGRKYFIKFAGAPAVRAGVSAEEAVANLKRAAPVYQDLAHSALIRLVETRETGIGFAAVFDWADAICAGRMYPSDYEKFKQLPLGTRVKIFEEITAFHAHVAARGYVAVDFYDGSIMYDMKNRRTVICDIDFYAKTPYINNMGRLWGSSRFMSPEEYQKGAVIDEVTNVYTMGRTAFVLFAEEEQSPEKWELSREMYNIAAKAATPRREERQRSINEFIDEWNNAGAHLAANHITLYN